MFSEKEGRYLPHIIEEPGEAVMQLILKVCSGKGFDFPANNQRIFGEENAFHTYTGSYKSISIGYASDDATRQRAASGGIISAMLIFLLRKGLIQGAVVLGMSKQKPWLTEPFIATTAEEILEAAQSKYILSSVNEILPQIGAFPGKLAYVGLPGQVQSIRSLQQIKHPWVQNIEYIFGPFYGNTLHFSSIRVFCDQTDAAISKKSANFISGMANGPAICVLSCETVRRFS